MTLYRYPVYSPNGTKRGMLTHATEVSFSSSLNELGSMTISHMPNGPGAQFLTTPCEVGVEVSATGDIGSWTEIPNGRFMLLGEDFEEIGGTSLRKYTLPNYGWQLNKVRQMQITDLNEDGKRPFLSATAGVIFQTLLQEAKARGVTPGITWNFTTTRDSSGQLWDKVITIYYEPGLDLYTILDNLAAQGVCDWRFQGRGLQLFNADSTLGFKSKTSLKAGHDVKSLPVKSDSTGKLDRVLILGDEGKRLKLTNPSVLMPWGGWEGFISNAGVSDEGTMTLLGNAMMTEGGRDRIQYTCEMNPDSSYHPFVDFIPGYYIKGPAKQKTTEEYRVRQINVTHAHGKPVQTNLVVNDMFQEREIRNAKKTNGIVGGATAGGSGAMPSPPRDDKRIPKQVLGLVAASSAYINALGNAQGQVVLAWDAVTQATNNTSIDQVRYAIWGRRNIVGESWRQLGTTDATRFTYSPLDVNQIYQFRVNALLNPGNRQGEFSATTQITIANDTTPPPRPSPPVLSTKLGTVTVTWDGLTSTGAAMPIDFSHIAVWWTGTRLDGTTGSKVLGSVQKGYGEDFLVVPQLAMVSQAFYFIAYDLSGNQSTASLTRTIIPKRIEGPDILANSITTNEIAAGAITTELLDASAVTAAKIAAGAITTVKLAADAVTAAKIASQTITAGEIAANTITSSRIGVYAIVADNIAAGAITADKITADAINGKTITGVTLNGATINATDSIGFRGGQQITGYVGQSGASWIEMNAALTVVGLTTQGVSLSGSSPAISGPGILIGTTQTRINARTTSAGANVYSGLAGELMVVGSLRKLKKKRQPLGVDYDILKLEPMTWVDSQELKDDPETTNRHAGFVAEDVRDLSQECDGVFDPLLTEIEGELQGLAYDRIPAYLIPVMRDMVSRIEILESENASMKQTVDDLAKRIGKLGG